MFFSLCFRFSDAFGNVHPLYRAYTCNTVAEISFHINSRPGHDLSVGHDTVHWRKLLLYFITLIKVKVKLSLCLFLTHHHAMKAYWGVQVQLPRIIDLGTRWKWVVSFTPRPLYPQGKRPWYTLDRRLGGPQSRLGHPAPAETRAPDHAACR
jgi:hypothetical protein